MRKLNILNKHKSERSERSCISRCGAAFMSKTRGPLCSLVLSYSPTVSNAKSRGERKKLFMSAWELQLCWRRSLVL